jgi:hypothetical protein
LEENKKTTKRRKETKKKYEKREEGGKENHPSSLKKPPKGEKNPYKEVENLTLREKDENLSLEERNRFEGTS